MEEDEADAQAQYKAIAQEIAEESLYAFPAYVPDEENPGEGWRLLKVEISPLEIEGESIQRWVATYSVPGIPEPLQDLFETAQIGVPFNYVKRQNNEGPKPIVRILKKVRQQDLLDWNWDNLAIELLRKKAKTTPSKEIEEEFLHRLTKKPRLDEILASLGVDADVLFDEVNKICGEAGDEILRKMIATDQGLSYSKPLI